MDAQLASVRKSLEVEKQDTANLRTQVDLVQPEKDQEIQFLDYELASAQAIHDAELVAMQKEKEDSLKAGLASIQKVKEAGNKEIADLHGELSALRQQKDQETESLRAETTATKKPHETETAKIRAELNAVRQQKGQEAKSLRDK